MGDDNDFVINTSDIIIKNKRYVRKIEHNKLDSYFENPDFFTLGKCNSDYTSLRMATSPDDNSGITKLDGSPVPEEINNGVFLRGAFMCHNMTSAYNLNNSPRNYGRFLSMLFGCVLLPVSNRIQYVNKNHENDLMYSDNNVAVERFQTNDSKFKKLCPFPVYSYWARSIHISLL